MVEVDNETNVLLLSGNKCTKNYCNWSSLVTVENVQSHVFET